MFVLFTIHEILMYFTIFQKVDFPKISKNIITLQPLGVGWNIEKGDCASNEIYIVYHSWYHGQPRSQ